jgi:hypothetical protein
MAYTATKNASGTYDVLQDGTKVTTGASNILGNYGLSETNLGGGTAIPITAPTQPATQAPITPAVQQPTPSVPQTQTPTTQSAATGPLALPANGSVVDLLNAAGQDSSYASRQQLAKQYGIQNYSGTAAQNQDLAQKYIDAYNAKKGTAVPQNGADARGAVSSYFQDNAAPQQANPEQSFYDAYAGMNPIVKNLYDSLNQAISSTGTRQTFTEQYNNLIQQQGIPGLQTDLLNIKKIMDGTDDDIRNEITAAGGFATDSQVQALAGARNKTLLKQAQSLQDQLAMKQDYVDQIMKLTEADQAQVDKDIDRKLGLTEQIATLQTQMDNAAKENYNKIVDTVGYDGLASMVSGNPQAQKQIEQVLSLPKGALSNPSWLSVFGKPKTSGMTSSIQEYEYAKAQGYSGSFNDYQNEDANRKAKAAGAGVAGLTAAQINQTVNQIAGNFDNEQIVKDYNQAASALRGIETIGPNTKSPTDDMAFIYAFAKVMDPNSVVREGEYKTVQDYGQALVQKAGLNLKRITDNSNFLTSDAKQKMLATLQTKVGAMKKGYDQVASEYQRQIDDAYSGKPRQITNYSATVGSTDDELSKLKSQLQPGELLVARETPTGRKYMAILPSELWATDITF